MKFAVAQINPKIGDFDQNVQRILLAISDARRHQAELVVFPELAVTGYPPRDLLDTPSFVDANLKALDQIALAGVGLTVVCGYIERNPSPAGRPFFNSAAVFQGGKQVATYRKRLLPYYDVFDEDRYFEPGNQHCIFNIGKIRIGITICEDAWGAEGFLPRPYPIQPLQALASERLDLVLNLSASPFHLGKPARRIELFQEMTQAVHAPVAVCNMVGGNDELLFDGCSLVISRSGKVVAAGRAFEEDLLTVDAQTAPLNELPWPQSEAEWLYKGLKLGLKDYVRKSGGSRVILGLSGGVDSSVCASIATAALGNTAVAGVSLPTRFTSSPSQEDARTLAENLGLAFRTIPIEPLFEAYSRLLEGALEGTPGSLTLENLQPRIRMTLLMALANEENRFLLNTSNKSEIACGYATLYGDAAGALSVLGDLTKKQVYLLAEYINRQGPVIPQRVIQRAPTAELRENQTDQDTLPPYEVLDLLVSQAVEKSRGSSELIKGGFQEQVVQKFQKLYAVSEYKRYQLPPVLRISSRSFGIGRRVPLAAKKPG